MTAAAVSVTDFLKLTLIGTQLVFLVLVLFQYWLGRKGRATRRAYYIVMAGLLLALGAESLMFGGFPIGTAFGVLFILIGLFTLFTARSGESRYNA